MTHNPDSNDHPTNSPAQIHEGYIIDLISGQEVRDTPEEREAVQVFAKILVEDYGYPRSHIQTRPQWRVKVRPSDTRKEYPIDIAVFNDENKTDDSIQIIVECKKKNRRDGKTQLQDYLRFSTARLGVWFNGEERLYLVKTERDGRILFDEIPNIPRFGQRLEDVGRFKRRDLRPATNLKSVFKAVRNYLAANAVGITRDEVFAQQLIDLIFCKIYDERFTRPDSIVRFRAGIGESSQAVKDRIINELFTPVKTQYGDVISVSDNITLDADSLTYIVGELHNYSLSEAERDAVAEAFEIFIGPSLKGAQGQFFTPRNVVKMVVDMIDPQPDEMIIDPACGSGGFLVEALRHVWRKVDQRGEDFDWPESEIFAEKQRVAIRGFRGIDKDNFLSKVAKSYMAILGDGRGGVFCENSLDNPTHWSAEARREIQMGSFDVVITNPPFGKKLAIDSSEILQNYDLGHAWGKNENGEYERLGVLDKQSPQILFVERCLNLLKPGGRLGIVLLESIFGMPKYRPIVDFIARNARILSIVTLPEDLFQPHTHAKTCVLICKKEIVTEPYEIFMADVKECGHDSRGNPTFTYNEQGERVILDEIPLVAPLYLRGNRND